MITCCPACIEHRVDLEGGTLSATTLSLTERQGRVMRATEAAVTATRETAEFIYANPEIAMIATKEVKSSTALAGLMEEFGFKVERGEGDVATAFVSKRGSGVTAER